MWRTPGPSAVIASANRRRRPDGREFPAAIKGICAEQPNLADAPPGGFPALLAARFSSKSRPSSKPEPRPSARAIEYIDVIS